MNQKTLTSSGINDLVTMVSAYMGIDTELRLVDPSDDCHSLNNGSSVPQINSKKDISIPINSGSERESNLELRLKRSPKNSPEAVDIMCHIARVVETLLKTSEQNRQLKEKLIEAVETDLLTGLGNKRSCILALESQIKESHLSFKPFTVVSVYLDHFGIINDLYGVKTGDQFLIKTATTLLEKTGDKGSVYRENGARFTIIMPETALEEACVHAETCKEAIELIQIPKVVNWQPVVSLGIAAWKFGMASVDDILESVDIAMFRYRRQRNRLPAKLQNTPVTSNEHLAIRSRLSGFLKKPPCCIPLD